MITTVVKRDGSRVAFSQSTIESAVKKAFIACGFEEDKIPYRLLKNISSKIQAKDVAEAEVETIQDWVVGYLMKSPYPKVAEAYISKRAERTKMRNSKLRKIFLDITQIKSTSVTRENGNMNADTPAGQMYKFGSEASKEFAHSDLLPEEFSKAHQEGWFHIHDLDYYATRSLTCLQHPLDRILHKGFVAGHGESRPAKRIETASVLGCISTECIQNEMHGGQAIPAFDFYMAPFVKMTFCEEIKNYCEALGLSMDKAIIESPNSYDKKPVEGLTGYARVYQLAINKTVSRVHQSMESFVHNSNVIHSRGGNQVVFSSINYGTDTSAEGRLVIREILNATYEGVGNGETAIFPIQIFKSKTGVSYLPTDPNYDLYKLACKVSAKRFYPNFINLDATFNQSPDWKPDDPKRYEHEVSTMGCRTRVFENRFGPTTSIGRGNLSFTTINLPRLGIEAMQKHKESLTDRVDEFFVLLDNMLDKTARQLDARYQYQSQALAKQFPLLMSGMWNGSDKLRPEDTIESVLNQGTLGIGFIGLAECLVALTGFHHAESEFSQALGLKIVKHMKYKADEFSEKYQHNYSILATPAEGLSGRFTRLDKKKYGTIIGVTDKEYYTNSNHVPVWYPCTASKKAAIECPYHEFTRGGHIFYVEMDGDPSDNPEAIMAVVDMLHKFNGGYASINYDANTCLDCGHKWIGKSRVCLWCGSTHIDTLRRVTGYLIGSLRRWNASKLAEGMDRVAHKILNR